MLPVEVVATMVPSRLPWYRRMQETAWAIIEEAFSEKIIVPGKTTPLVSFPFLIIYPSMVHEGLRR